MFKVDCPGCKAPYQVDERRVPKTGLKMRCPKCGTSFKVDAPDDAATSAPTPVLGASLGLKGGTQPVRPQPQSKAAAAGLKSTMLGVAAPAGVLDAKPKKPPLPSREKPPLPSREKPPLPKREKPPLPTQAKPPSATAPLDDPYSEAELPMLGRSAGTVPDADLPAVPRPVRAEDASFELDLPSPAGAGADLPALPDSSGADLPAVPRPAIDAGSEQSGLPAIPRRRADSSGLEIDLPTVGGGGLDLPSPSRASGLELGGDLPQPSADLPSPTGGGAGGSGNVPLLSLDSVVPGPNLEEQQAALPSPSAGLPSPSAGLPSPSAGLPLPSAGLPSPSAGLPSPSAGLPSPSAGLPSPSAGLPSPQAGLPSPQAGLPSPGQDLGPDLNEGHEIQSFSLPPEASLDLDAPRAGSDDARVSGGFGELDLSTEASQANRDSGGEFDFGGEADFGGGGAEPGPSEAQHATRSAGGGVAFGEVDLAGGDDAGGEVALEDAPAPPVAGGGAQAPPAEEDMEFGAIPQEDQAPGAVTAGAEQVQMRVGAQLPTKTKTGVKVAVGVVALICIGGGALSMLPEVGPFGYYLITDTLKSGEYERAVQDAVVDSRRTMAQDTFPSARLALKRIELRQTEKPRVRALAAYSAFLGLAGELRFGTNSEAHARAKVLLDGLAEHEGQVDYAKQARAALAAVDGKLSAARRDLKVLLRAESKNIDLYVLLGELELKAKDGKAAHAAWAQAQKLEKSARTTFGMARALSLEGDDEAAEKAARAAIEKQADHSGAKLLVVRLIVGDRDRDRQEEALKLVQSVIEDGKKASKAENVEAQTLLGLVYVWRQRIGAAEAAFTEALKIDPKAADALEGLGGTLYVSARFSEALARYEAAVQANPNSLPAKLGVVECKLALERVKEAISLAEEVAKAHPKSSRAAKQLGFAYIANGSTEQAEAALRKSIELAGKDDEAVDAYVTLAGILLKKGNTEEAQKLLDTAREELPESAAIHKAMGELALAQGRYEDAIGEFDAALKLDPEHLRVMFERGVALRRARKFEEALAALEAVAKRDKEFPGLALERGLLYEASGRADEALKEYEAALAKAPDDPDLMLRVGCSDVSAGRGKEAEKLLKKVLQQRPNSAETAHCLGRALLLDGTRLAEALKNLQRAAAIDPHRAEYHLYVGWAANEARNFKLAHRALEKALSLDQSLADAYWQRGLLLSRQGAVKDAIVDLKKALDLRPTRYEAHAALADAYYDLGREAQALSHWSIAVANIPDRPEWRFRYGKLLAANRQTELAKVNLSEAIKIVTEREESPSWLPQAHLLLAQAIGLRKESIEHWEGFLKGAQRDSPYRAEAIKALRKLGKPWSGD